MTIDNGNHLLLSGNESALAYAKKIGGEAKLAGPDEASIRFLRSRARKRAGRCGPMPENCRGGFSRLTGASPIRRASTISPWSNCCSRSRDQLLRPYLGTGEIARNLWDPLFVSALNTDPAEASAALAGAIVRETFARGGDACRPVVAVDGLSARLRRSGAGFSARARRAQLRFGAKLRAHRVSRATA